MSEDETRAAQPTAAPQVAYVLTQEQVDLLASAIAEAVTIQITAQVAERIVAAVTEQLTVRHQAEQRQRLREARDSWLEPSRLEAARQGQQ